MPCPTCNSPSADRHPAVQHGGEVEICRDKFHWSSPLTQDHPCVLNVREHIENARVNGYGDLMRKWSDEQIAEDIMGCTGEFEDVPFPRLCAYVKEARRYVRL